VIFHSQKLINCDFFLSQNLDNFEFFLSYIVHFCVLLNKNPIILFF
jgi:hypothetical protein